MKPARPVMFITALGLAAIGSGSAAPPTVRPDLTGRWARVEVTTALSELPVLGSITSETTSVVMLDVQQDGAMLTLEEEVCAIENESFGGMVRARFPRPFLAAVSGGRAKARLLPAGGGFRYVEERPVQVYGAQLAEPTSDPLPEGRSDPRLVDEDDDGQPGLTVKLEGFVDGEVYVVQRAESALSGVLRDAKRIEGTVRWRVEQSVVGASRSMLKQDPDNRPHPEEKRSFFRMRRIPKNATCPQVLARAERLLGVSPRSTP